MDGNGEPNDASRFAIDVVAALHPELSPTMTLDGLGKLFAGNGPHTTISSTRSLFMDFGCWTSTDKQPSTAS